MSNTKHYDLMQQAAREDTWQHIAERLTTQNAELLAALREVYELRSVILNAERSTKFRTSEASFERARAAIAKASAHSECECYGINTHDAICPANAREKE